METDLTISILSGDPVDDAAVELLNTSARAALIEQLLDESAGRRWLRASRLLDRALADRLLHTEDDFRSTRRDRTVARVVGVASLPALLEHVDAIAAGSGAAALWERLANTDELLVTATRVISRAEAASATAALYLLVLDPVGDYGLERRSMTQLAEAGLASPHGEVRGLAAEHLVSAAPDVLAADAERFVRDEDERLRNHAWHASFLRSPAQAGELALALVGDETTALPVRRSALTAYGEHLPTAEVVDVLAFFVGHPNEALALDAAQLMVRLHRQPTIATAAASSPHEPVRELALFLLDPYRGSPAAGGSRPGDPTAGDIFAEIARRLDEDEQPRERNLP